MEGSDRELRRLLRELPQLRRLGEDDIGLLARLGTQVEYRRGRTLVYQGERCSGAFLVVQGRLRLLKYRSDESCLVIGEAGPGEWVGLAEAVLDCVALVDATAVAGSLLLSYAPGSLAALRKKPAIQDHLLGCMARAAYRLHLRIEENQPLPRLVRFLLEHAAGGEEQPAVRATQDQIAEAIGVTRETVNRYLQLLKAEGIVRVARGSIDIVDPRDLQKRLLV